MVTPCIHVQSVYEAHRPVESIEIQELFEHEDLPREAAHALTDPAGDYNYSSLPMLCELVTFEDLRGVNIQIGPARRLLKKLQPGGEIHNMLVLTGRISRQVALGRKAGSSSSGHSSGQSGGSSVKTSIRVTRIDKERVSTVANQLREQRRLSALCGEDFQNLPPVGVGVGVGVGASAMDTEIERVWPSNPKRYWGTCGLL